MNEFEKLTALIQALKEGQDITIEDEGDVTVETTDLEGNTETYFLARLRDRIVMQDCSIIIEDEQKNKNNHK